jgi:Fe-S-cluster containining protein
MDQVTAVFDVLTDESDPSRSCGGCTACCTVLAVDELRKPMRCACPHQSAVGCRIYEERPLGCRQFNCVWLRGGLPAEEAWRPDRLGVIFDDFIRATDGQRQRTAFEVFPEAFRQPAMAALLRRMVDDSGIELALQYRDGGRASLVPGSDDAG